MVDYLMVIRNRVDLCVVSASRESGRVRPPSMERPAVAKRALHDMGECMKKYE